MPNGTILNGVFAARIHKSNAHSVKYEADELRRYCRDKLLILVASSPQVMDGVAWPDYVRDELDGLLESLHDAWWKELCARHIIEEPENCKDELEPADWDEPEHEGNAE
jgi:hypothetical protein|tara:strand:+ start:3022 stop:3348 length:327 start_codon:yes stop_codon:yes gene_type:complete